MTNVLIVSPLFSSLLFPRTIFLAFQAVINNSLLSDKEMDDPTVLLYKRQGSINIHRHKPNAKALLKNIPKFLCICVCDMCVCVSV